MLERRIHLFELVIGEVDLTSRSMQDQEFEGQVFGIFARAGGDADIGRGFDELAESLARASGLLRQDQSARRRAFPPRLRDTSELIEFATRVIELEGGAVEPHASGIHALLSEEERPAPEYVRQRSAA